MPALKPAAPPSNPDLTRIAIWTFAPSALLLIPLIAMTLTDAVVWTAGDFFVAAGLLCGAGGGYAILTRVGSAMLERWIVGGLILVGLITIWVALI